MQHFVLINKFNKQKWETTFSKREAMLIWPNVMLGSALKLKGLYKVQMFSAKIESVLFSCFLWVWFRNPRSNIRLAENLIQCVWRLESTHVTEMRLQKWQRGTDNFALFCCSSCFRVSKNTVDMFASENQNTNVYENWTT